MLVAYVIWHALIFMFSVIQVRIAEHERLQS